METITSEVEKDHTNKEAVKNHTREVALGKRFEFGRNWSRFLAAVDERRIAQAEVSLRRMLEVESLAGRSFLDIGSGSGLFSLAARRMGAWVYSFDYDPKSVACTAELKRRYYAGDPAWMTAEGSALNTDFIASLGQFDVVYAWGVLHHTGNMWRAMELAGSAVAPGGKLFIAIYNDTGSQSARWKRIKWIYNRLPRIAHLPFTLIVIAPQEMKAAMRALVRGRPGEYVRSWFRPSARGMSRWHDIVDWIGGYPYEVAKPEEVFDFYRARGFTLTKMACGGVGLGCNEFVFVRSLNVGDGAQ